MRATKHVKHGPGGSVSATDPRLARIGHELRAQAGEVAVMGADSQSKLRPRNRGLRRLVQAAWAAVLLCLASSAGTASANAALSPLGTPPPGFTAESKGGVRWTYPSAAAHEVDDLQRALPEAWQRISAQLGGAIDARLEVRVARNGQEMQALAPAEVRVPDYAVGLALPTYGEHGLVLLRMTAPRTWQSVDLETVLVHELSHMALFRLLAESDQKTKPAAGQPASESEGIAAFRVQREVPRWFAEGLAMVQAKERRLARIRALWEGTLSGELMPLEQLRVRFPGRHHSVNLAYAQSADFVSFLLQGEDNAHRFNKLVAGLRRGLSWDEAFQDAYHLSVGYMERQWREALHRRFGRWPLLLSSLTGLWVLGSILLVVAYLKKRKRDRQTRLRWEREEALAHRHALPKPDRVEPPVDSDPIQLPGNEIPTVNYNGENYTLH